MRMSLLNVAGDPYWMTTIVISIVGWVLALVGSVCANANNTDIFPIFSWWVLAFEVLAFSYALYAGLINELRMYRGSVVGLFSIATVYTSFTVNRFIYSSAWSTGMAAGGFILLSIANILLIMLFGTTNDEPLHQSLNHIAVAKKTGTKSFVALNKPPSGSANRSQMQSRNIALAPDGTKVPPNTRTNTTFQDDQTQSQPREVTPQHFQPMSSSRHSQLLHQQMQDHVNATTTPPRQTNYQPTPNDLFSQNHAHNLEQGLRMDTNTPVQPRQSYYTQHPLVTPQQAIPQVAPLQTTPSDLQQRLPPHIATSTPSSTSLNSNGDEPVLFPPRKAPAPPDVPPAQSNPSSPNSHQRHQSQSFGPLIPLPAENPPSGAYPHVQPNVEPGIEPGTQSGEEPNAEPDLASQSNSSIEVSVYPDPHFVRNENNLSTESQGMFNPHDASHVNKENMGEGTNMGTGMGTEPNTGVDTNVNTNVDTGKGENEPPQTATPELYQNSDLVSTDSARTEAWVRAIESYSPNDSDDEIPFQKGEVMAVYDVNGQWWYCRKSDGRHGMCPRNYLEIIDH